MPRIEIQLDDESLVAKYQRLGHERLIEMILRRPLPLLMKVDKWLVLPCDGGERVDEEE
jgi:hypothetical protein